MTVFSTIAVQAEYLQKKAGLKVWFRLLMSHPPHIRRALVPGKPVDWGFFDVVRLDQVIMSAYYRILSPLKARRPPDANRTFVRFFGTYLQLPDSSTSWAEILREEEL